MSQMQVDSGGICCAMRFCISAAFFCQLCPAGVRVGIRNDAAQRDPEQLLIDDVVFQRNSILKSEQQIDLYIPADFAILSSRDAAALSAS